MRRMVVLTLSLVAALAVVGGAQATSNATITGTVGPGFTITVSKKTVKAGTHTFKISDKSNIHNWHITGPGINKSTTISFTGSKTWKLKLKKGTYTIVCDPHASSMRTTLKVT